MKITNLKNVLKYSYVVYTEDKMAEDDLEISLLKIENVDKAKEIIKAKDLVNNDKLVELNFNNIELVELNKLNLLKNYIVNSSLSWGEESTPEGELECAKIIFKILESSTNLDNSIINIKSEYPNFFNEDILISNDEDFDNMRKDIVDKINHLTKINDIEKEYISDAIYLFNGDFKSEIA